MVWFHSEGQNQPPLMMVSIGDGTTETGHLGLVQRAASGLSRVQVGEFVGWFSESENAVGWFNGESSVVIRGEQPRDELLRIAEGASPQSMAQWQAANPAVVIGTR